MVIEAGRLVWSATGRDKYMLFRVTRVSPDGRWCFLRDGKTRKLSRPKKKNARHVLITDRVLDIRSIKDDGTLRRMLRETQKEVFDPWQKKT